MSQDVISDGLNMIMNMKKAGKTQLELKRYSKVLIQVLELMQEDKLIEYKLDEKEKKIVIEIKELSECKSIKPRFQVKVDAIEKYVRRFLPARGMGKVIVSTDKGLKSNEEAIKENMGGSLIAYFY